MENFIEECKNGYPMDNVSKGLHVKTNGMQMTGLAYNIIKGLLQLALLDSFQKMQFETLSPEIFKVVAKKK